MKTKPKLLTLSGSTRKNSSNEKLLQAIAREYAEEYSFENFDLESLPYFSAGLPPNEIPANVITFLGKISAADAILICSPEYVFSLPGILKNALEWTVSETVFSFKPFAFIILSASGIKAFESLDLIMSTLLQEEIPTELKLLISGGQGKFNENGHFTDQQTQKAVFKLMNALTICLKKN
ncbi:NADPH-dependent FMN reductase [Pedobacter antarcticus]|uniref:NADPH-dependent FMN reductase n=2 Tax=Pedobacter antarcticus TaxID=34086 RepID=UPI002931AC89|nr:NADPH-dependent FMN reductase [Pedobacter antarcticus]